MSLSSSSPNVGRGLPVDSETIPDRIVHVCSKCSRSLSVGERMFYFLEAVNAPALCRNCVREQEQEIVTGPTPPDEGPVAPSAEGPGRVASSPLELPPLPPRGPFRRRPITVPDPEAEVGRPSTTIGSLPSGARRLRRAASAYLEQDRLDEAIECIRELALEIGLSESGSISPPPALAAEGGTVRGGSGPSVAPDVWPLRGAPTRGRDGGPTFAP